MTDTRSEPTSPELTELADALVRLADLVQQVFVEVSRNYELTPQQAELLCMLTSGPVGMAELSRALHLEKSSLTGLVDRVERRGLVVRVRDTRDRRACQIELTEQGAKLAYASHAEISARLEALAGDLPQAERHQLTSTVERLTARSDAENGHGPALSG